MKIDARLTFDKFRSDQDTNAHLVLTLTAPPIEAQTKRPALCIIPLIDVSPSMEGEKLAYAKRSVEKLIEHLGPGDYCGLVTFSGQAQVLQKPVKVTADSKADLKRKIAGLRTDSATNIADALLVGLDVGNKMDLPGTVIVRAILFTDGQANRGPATDTAGLVKLLKANLGSCTLSAFGYGSDADQVLLGELAKVGSGNYAFVQNPDDALTAFGKELGGLLSCYGTNLLINVTACGDHEITDVVSDVDSEEEKIGQGVRIKIPEILAEEVRHIVLAVKLKAQKGGPRPVNLFEVKAGWDVLDAGSKKERLGGEAKAKAQFVKDGDQQAAPDSDLDKIVSLAEIVQAQAEAEAKAQKGDYRGAQAVMHNAALNVGNRGHVQAQNLAHAVSARMGSHALYTSGGAYLRSVAGGVTRGVGTSGYDVQAAADLGNLGVQMSNSYQTTTSNSFAHGGLVVEAGPITAGDAISLTPFAGSPFDGTVVGIGVDINGPNPLLGASWVADASAAPPAIDLGNMVAKKPDQPGNMVAKKPGLSKKKSKRTW